MKQVVIIPTYNEKQNIEGLVRAILRLNLGLHVLVVDDNSPDGTGTLVKRLQKSLDRLHLLERRKKDGLGPAYIAGFKWSLDRGYDRVFQMDADFSHRPVDLVKLVQALNGHDFVIGSRYIPEGQVENWGAIRRFISRGGSIYAGLILTFALRDWTGGFNGWRRRVLKSLDLDAIRSDGYCFQIEMKYRALKAGFRFLEVPITFSDRTAGKSKMSMRIVFEAVYRVWLIRFLRRAVSSSMEASGEASVSLR